MNRNLLFALLMMLLVGPAYAQDGGPVFEADDCPFPAPEGVTCGWLIVPEDHTNPDSPEIELAVVILDALNGSSAPEPVVYLEGGPGGAGVFVIDDLLQHPIRETHDVILLDQRGTGFSYPSLNCYEMETDEYDEILEALDVCYQRLQDEGVNLDAYNSAQSAADINALRESLGYEQVNLWGVSYGTRLGLTVLRDYPDAVRAAVLDSVFPPQENTLEQSVRNSINAFETLLDGCAADATCAAAYPTLEADFYALVADFNANPPVFDYDDGFDVYEVELFGDDILDAIFLAMYDSAALPMLPLGIDILANAEDDIDLQDGYDLVQGYYTPDSWNGIGEQDGPEGLMDSDDVLDYLDEYGDVTDAEGLFHSVNCGEELPFNDLDRAYTLVDSAPDVLQTWLAVNIENELLDCDVWQVALTDAVEAEPVTSDVPTLLISGAYDPVTPPSAAESALRTLSNGQHVVFAAGGHGESIPLGCGGQLAAAFFDDPTGPLPTNCATSATVDWYTE